jgi:putative membrane protein
MKITRTWLLLGAGALFVASADAAAQTRTTGSGIRVSKDIDVSTTPSTTTIESPGEVSLTTSFALSAYANMNEKNITAHMAAGDSLEIQLAQLAATKGTAQAVRDYASTLQTDHTAHLAKTIEIITDEDVGAEPMANDPEGARLRQMLSHLRDMPAGTNWDAMFLRFQAQHHQNEIDLLSANLKNAHDDDLEEHIEASLTSLAKHRDAAKSVGAGLGLTF